MQFSRSIGGAVGVSVMGAVLSARLASGLVAEGIDPATVSIDSLIGKVPQSAVVLGDALRHALSGAIHGVFIVAFLVALLALAAVTFAPRGRIAELVAQRSAAPRPAAAEPIQPPASE